MVSQNFVLLTHSLSLDKQKYIPGLLKLPTNEFCVPVETANKLAHEYPEVKILMERLPGTIQQCKEDVYIFSEDNILSFNRTKLTPYDRMKALLLLKGGAVAPEKNYYVADSKYSGFAINYLLDD